MSNIRAFDPGKLFSNLLSPRSESSLRYSVAERLNQATGFFAAIHDPKTTSFSLTVPRNVGESLAESLGNYACKMQNPQPTINTEVDSRDAKFLTVTASNIPTAGKDQIKRSALISYFMDALIHSLFIPGQNLIPIDVNNLKPFDAEKWETFLASLDSSNSDTNRASAILVNNFFVDNKDAIVDSVVASGSIEALDQAERESLGGEFNDTAASGGRWLDIRDSRGYNQRVYFAAIPVGASGHVDVGFRDFRNGSKTISGIDWVNGWDDSDKVFKLLSKLAQEATPI